MNPHTSCTEWLHASKIARETYLGKKWPHLHLPQVNLIVRDQSLGCVVAPGRAHAAMGSLQAAVDVAVLGFADLYEGALEDGAKESVESFYGEVLGIFHMNPARPRRSSAGHGSSKPSKR